MDQVMIRSWGNSLGIRLPKKILDRLGIGSSDVLNVEINNNSIVLSKAFKHKTFEERLAEYDGQISVFEYDWGEPVGKEML